MAADAEPHGADSVSFDKILAFQERLRRTRISNDFIRLQAAQEFNPFGEPGLIIAIVNAGTSTMEKIWGESNVSFSRHTFGDITNVGVHAEDLHKHQHGGTQRTISRTSEVAPHSLPIDADMHALRCNFHTKSSLLFIDRKKCRLATELN